MTKTMVTGALLLILQVPSSTIPERREFPVNSAVNPCVDFHAYACSKVEESFKLRDDRSVHTFAFSDSAERLLEKKKAFLAGLENNHDLSARGITLRNFYGACMNEKASAAEERGEVARFKGEVAALKDRDQFQTFLADKIVSTDLSFVTFGPSENLDQPEWSDVFLSGDLQTLPERSYYENEKLVRALEALMADTFKAAGVDRAAERARWVIEFEKQFTLNYPLPRDERERDNQRNMQPRQFFLDSYPALKLAKLFTQLPQRTVLRNFYPETMTFLNRAVAEMPVEQLKSVYLFHAIKGYMDDAYPDNFKKWFKFKYEYLGGPEKRPDRQERCTREVMGSFLKEIDAELWQILFPNFPTERFVALAERVRSAIIEGLRDNQWLTRQARKAAIKKIQAAHLMLVAPRTDAEWNFNPPAEYKLDAPYSNRQTLSHNLLLKMIRELGEKRHRERWWLGPLTINAYYDSNDNKFVLPVGVLQYPFYDPQLPDETNLGAVGVVMGHELGHGIDDQGSKYDAEGRLKPWMTDKDLEQFHRRSAQLVDQFNRAGHDGQLTLGENIGDLVGVTFAYRAAFGKRHPSREEQRAFFTEYGRVWCGVERPKYRDVLLKTDPHALRWARINEQVKQQPAFQEAFECKPGDPMTLPESERVKIW